MNIMVGTISWAACYNRTKVIDELIEQGIEIDIKNDDQDGTTASRSRSRKSAELLIEKGANTHAFDNNKNTSLMYASRYGKRELVELLIERDSDIDSTNIDRRNSLIYACEGRYTNLVELLIDRGSNINL